MAASICDMSVIKEPVATNRFTDVAADARSFVVSLTSL